MDVCYFILKVFLPTWFTSIISKVYSLICTVCNIVFCISFSFFFLNKQSYNPVDGMVQHDMSCHAQAVSCLSAPYECIYSVLRLKMIDT